DSAAQARSTTPPAPAGSVFRPALANAANGPAAEKHSIADPERAHVRHHASETLDRDAIGHDAVFHDSGTGVPGGGTAKDTRGQAAYQPNPAQVIRRSGGE